MMLALVCVTQGTPASAACVLLAGTADGFDKETAVSRAQRSVEDNIQQYKTEHHLGAVSVSAMRAEPQPYWRGRVSENMMYHPTELHAADSGFCVLRSSLLRPGPHPGPFLLACCTSATLSERWSVYVGVWRVG